MSALASPDDARRRVARFFHGTTRTPLVLSDDHDEHSAPRNARGPNSALEIDALRVIRGNLEARALSQGGQKLTDVQLSRMLQAAQHTLRGMTDDQLKSVASSGSTLESIVAASFNAIAATDLQRFADLQKINASGGDGTGTDPLRLLRGADDLRGRISSAERQREMGSERLSTEERAQVASATAMAKKLGMPWALNNPDLLRLGPAAITAIAQTNLKEAGYKALREGSHYEAKDIVTFAKHAKIKGFNAEEAAHATSALVQAQPSDQQKALAEALKAYDRAVIDAHDHPNDAAARQRLDEAGKRQKEALKGIAAQSPEHTERVRRFEDSKKIEEQHRATVQAEATANTKDVKADADQAATGQKLDDLDAIANLTPADAKSAPAKAAEAPQKEIKSAEVKQDEKKAAPKAPTLPKPA